MILTERVVLETRRQIACPVHADIRARLNLRHVVVKGSEVELVFVTDHVVHATDQLILIESIARRSEAVKIGPTVGRRKEVCQILCRKRADSAERNPPVCDTVSDKLPSGGQQWDRFLQLLC